MSGPLDGLGERIVILGELLQHQQPRIDHHHRVEHVGALLAFDQVEGGGAREFALIGSGNRFERQGDQADLAQGIERRGGACGAYRLRAAHQSEAQNRLLRAVVAHGDVFGLEIGDGLALLVAHNEVQQNLIDVRLDGRLLLWPAPEPPLR